MDEMVEVVEEEVIDDDDAIYEYYDEDGEYEEYVIEDDQATQRQTPPTDTVIVKVNPDTVDPMKRKFRVAPADITDGLFAAFCRKVMSPQHELASRQLNDKLDSIYHSGDWAVAYNLPDRFLGDLDLAMIHLPTSKYHVKKADRDRLLGAVMAKHQNARNPIGIALQEIQKTYIGLPPIGQLRNLLSLELRKIFPLASDSVNPMPTYRKLAKRATGWKAGYRPKKMRTQEGEGGEDVGEKGNEADELRSLVITPIDDDMYDHLAEVIASGQRQPEMEYSWPMPVKALLAKGALVAEQCDHTNVDLEEVIRAGWLIRERATGRIVPRKSDVDRIWHRVHRKMERVNSLAQIMAYVDAKFVGISSAEQRRLARTDDVFKGDRVQFPPSHAVIGRRPMQYVQIDILEHPSSFDEFAPEEEDVESALLLVDLHSQYAFCKPLLDPSDSSIELMRFLLDCFTLFGPPEGFVVGSDKNWEWIRQTMVSVESHYKVDIKCIGMAKEHACGRAISADAARKTDGDAGFRWLEMLDGAALEWNQRPCKLLDCALSPFEVMFGRPAWRDCGSNCSSRLPPWIDPLPIASSSGRKGGGREEEAVGPSRETERLQLKKRIERVIGSLQSRDAVMDGDRVVDPGTGMKYEIGDRVYVRNMYYVEGKGAGDGRKGRGAAVGGGRNEEKRYLRGCVVQEDSAHPEFFYRVTFDPHLAMQGEEWPTVEHDNRGEMSTAWFSPWDLAPSSFDMQCRRTTDPPKEVSDAYCKCGVAHCDMIVDEECVKGRGASCCAKHDEGPCTAHKSVRRRCGKRRKEEREVVRVSRSLAEETTPVEEDSGDRRYLLKDGGLVLINTIGGKMDLPLPDDILQE